jgi:hypothetical protein
MPAFQVQNPSKQNQQAAIQFFVAEGCQLAKEPDITINAQ